MLMSRQTLALRSLICCLLFAGLVGCQQMNLFRFQSPEEEVEEDSLSRVLKEEHKAGRRSLVGEYTTISGKSRSNHAAPAPAQYVRAAMFRSRRRVYRMIARRMVRRDTGWNAAGISNG